MYRTRSPDSERPRFKATCDCQSKIRRPCKPRRSGGGSKKSADGAAAKELECMMPRPGHRHVITHSSGCPRGAQVALCRRRCCYRRHKFIRPLPPWLTWRHTISMPFGLGRMTRDLVDGIGGRVACVRRRHNAARMSAGQEKSRSALDAAQLPQVEPSIGDRRSVVLSVGPASTAT